jgi:hypothetical protein
MKHPFVGKTWQVAYGDFLEALNAFHDDGQRMTYKVTAGPFAGAEATVTYEALALGNGCFLLSWQEADRGTVSRVDDFERGTSRSYYTTAQLELVRMSGTIAPV